MWFWIPSGMGKAMPHKEGYCLQHHGYSVGNADELLCREMYMSISTFNIRCASQKKINSLMKIFICTEKEVLIFFLFDMRIIWVFLKENVTAQLF